MKISVGTDPEFMISRAGQFVSAIPIFGPHGKENPLSLREGVTGYWDNVNAEFTVPPAYSAEEMVGNISDMFAAGTAFLANSRSQLVVKAAHKFDDDQLVERDAHIFGCRPEMSIHTGPDGKYLKYPTPSAEQIGNLRVCGGHIHVGRDDYKEHMDSYEGFLMAYESKYVAALYMDLYLGLALTAIDKDPTNAARKALYGHPGSMRETPYGLEYRTLSNFWLHHPELVRLVFDLTQASMGYYYNDPTYFEKHSAQELYLAIENADQQRCWDLFMASPVPGDLKERVKAALDIPFDGNPTY